jgi:23S rRNA pseudouridine2457 synthase
LAKSLPTRTHQYFKFYKPYGYCSQFTDEGEAPGLARILELPKDVYPVGRLDKDSEGLLLLSNDNRFKTTMLTPGHLVKTYWVQVEGIPDNEKLAQLMRGLEINIKGSKNWLKALSAHVLEKAPDVPDRQPPIRFRKNVADTWLQISINEGKNRQIRKMTAAIGHPTLRLMRISVGKYKLENMKPWQILSIQP